MIRVSVLYPNGPDAAFDHDYYRTKHIPMVKNGCGDALVKAEIDKGLADGTGGSPPYVAAGHLFFNTMEDFQSAMGARGAEFTGDVPNYTNVQPEIVISEVVG